MEVSAISHHVRAHILSRVVVWGTSSPCGLQQVFCFSCDLGNLLGIFWIPTCEKQNIQTEPWNYKTLSPWKESYDKPGQYIKKQSPHFADKDPYDQSYGFASGHIWMWELDHKEGWAPKIWCFRTVVRRLLRDPWTARRLNQSILKEINSDYSLEGLILKLKLQYFGHLMGRADSFEKTLMLGKIEAEGEGSCRGWNS